MHISDFTEDGQFDLRKIAAKLCTSVEELAMTVGLSEDDLQLQSRINSDETQQRLRGLFDVLNKVEPRFASLLMAYAWYRSVPLAGFGSRTAMHLVQEGNAWQVLKYIDSIDAGVYA